MVESRVSEYEYNIAKVSQRSLSFSHPCQRCRTYFRFNMAASMACQAAVRGLRAASTKQLLFSRNNQVTDR